MFRNEKIKSGNTAIVIFHYFISSVSFLVGCILLLFAAKSLGGHHFQPKLLALTHLFVIGWITTIIMGTSYQLIPVILGSQNINKQLSWTSIILLIAGLPYFIIGFWQFTFNNNFLISALLVAISLLLYCANLIIALKKYLLPDTGIQFIKTSLLYLFCTVCIGIILITNYYFPFLKNPHINTLSLHAHLGLIGWILLLIIGVSSKLLPMFLLSTKSDTKLLTKCYWLINVSLLGLLIERLFINNTIVLYLIESFGAAGLLIYLKYMLSCYKNRLKRKLDIGMRATEIFPVLLISGILFHICALFTNSSNLNYVLFGMVFILGCCGAIIMGQTLKTLPYIIWHFEWNNKPNPGNRPSPDQYYSQLNAKITITSMFTGILLLGIGKVLELPFILTTGIISLIITAISNLTIIVTILKHYIRVKNGK